MTNFKSISNITNFKYYKLFDICLLICLFGYLLIWLLPKQVHAQSLSLSIWPPLLEVMIQPGRSVTQVYKLTNNSDHDLEITPRIFPFKPIGESGQIKIKFPASKSKDGRGKLEEDKGKNFFSFGSGEKFDQPFHLPVGQTRETILKINLPKNNPEADYYYTLLFSTAAVVDEKNPTSAQSISQIGTNILITVSQTGQPTLLGRILEFSTSKIIDSFSPAVFIIRLENWGKTFWKPFGKIKTTGIFKQKEEIGLQEQNILAESSRCLSVDPVKPKLPLGPFKASLELTLNEDGPKLSSEIVFWYLPYKLATVIFASISAIFLLKKILNRGQNTP